MTITTKHHEHSRTGGDCTQLRDGLSDAELTDLEEVLDSAAGLLGDASIPRLEDIHDFTHASAALETGWDSVRAALRGGQRATERVTDATCLDDLLARMQCTERVMKTAEVRHRDRSVRIAWETLADLQDMTSVPQLIEAGAEAVCKLGFDRAIVSSIHESTWLTESLYVDGDSEWAEEILAAGRQAPQQITAGLPEQDLVRRRRPILVTRVQQKETVHTAVAEASQSRSYVAAPIMPRSRVMGFLHGDRFFHRGDVTQFDSDLLGLFAQGYGFALERAMLIQELAEVRGQLLDLTAGLDRVAQRCEGAGTFNMRTETQPAPTPPSSFSPRPSPTQRSSVLHMQLDTEPDSRLTRREQEVLRLLAGGDTNHKIATKLIISEGTVKSHVKHILRKLGAANRAEAVSRWHSGTSF